MDAAVARKSEMVIGEPASDVPVIVQSQTLEDILTSVNQIAYVWTISENRIDWLGDVSAVLGVAPEKVSLASDFAGFLPAKGGSSRADTILKASDMMAQTDDEAGVAYCLRFPFRANASSPITWFTDTGRFYGMSDGRPYQARGILRAITSDGDASASTLEPDNDELTGQVRRSVLVERIDAVLSNARKAKSGSGFLIAAIDDLSRYNDLFGFDVTDQVITNVVQRMKTGLRAGDAIGRYSGNKFGIILNNCQDSEMEIAARRLRAAVSEGSFDTAAGPISASVSLGGVTFPKHGTSAQTIVQHAHEALDTARSLGSSNYMSYRPSESRENQRKLNMRITDDILSALDEERFLLALQPISDPVSYEPRFYECLLRIRHRDGTVESAGHLVPHAERLGLINHIDSRVLDLAMEILNANEKIALSLNVSAGASADSDWISELLSHLGRCPGGAERLIVEITESMAIADVEAAQSFVRRLKDIGCRVAIDDFGAGYSSFRNLKMLDVDMIKIDGSFVLGCHRQEEDQAFVRALLQLAQSLKLETVAEWIEDEADATILRQLGVDYIQGFIAGHPQTYLRPGTK